LLNTGVFKKAENVWLSFLQMVPFCKFVEYKELGSQLLDESPPQGGKRLSLEGEKENEVVGNTSVRRNRKLQVFS